MAQHKLFEWLGKPWLLFAAMFASVLLPVAAFLLSGLATDAFCPELGLHEVTEVAVFVSGCVFLGLQVLIWAGVAVYAYGMVVSGRGKELSWLSVVFLVALGLYAVVVHLLFSLWWL